MRIELIKESIKSKIKEGSIIHLHDEGGVHWIGKYRMIFINNNGKYQTLALDREENNIIRKEYEDLNEIYESCKDSIKNVYTINEYKILIGDIKEN